MRILPSFLFTSFLFILKKSLPLFSSLKTTSKQETEKDTRENPALNFLVNNMENTILSLVVNFGCNLQLGAQIHGEKEKTSAQGAKDRHA